MKQKKTSAKSMKGKPNASERKALRLLEDWHKGAKRKGDFSGKIRGAVGSGGFPQQRDF